jgi:hypothetical protein
MLSLIIAEVSHCEPKTLQLDDAASCSAGSPKFRLLDTTVGCANDGKCLSWFGSEEPCSLVGKTVWVLSSPLFTLMLADAGWDVADTSGWHIT